MTLASESVSALNSALSDVGENVTFSRPGGSFSGKTYSFDAAAHSMSDSGNGLLSKLRAGYYVTISGSASNDGDFKTGTVLAGTAALLTPAGQPAIITDELAGATVTIQVTSTLTPVNAKAFVRFYTAKELASAGAAVSDMDMTVSPTPFLAAGWPNPPLITKTTDKVLVRGTQRSVKSADVKSIGDTPIRVNLIVAG